MDERSVVSALRCTEIAPRFAPCEGAMISPSVARNAVRGFWPGLGREKLGFYGHGRQPVRPLLITGRDPGSSEPVPSSIFGARMANLYSSPRFTRSGAA